MKQRVLAITTVFRRERLPSFLIVFALLLAAYTCVRLYQPIIFATAAHVRLTTAPIVTATTVPTVFPLKTFTFVDTPYRRFTVDLAARGWVREPSHYLLAGFTIATPSPDEVLFVTNGREWSLARQRVSQFVARELAPMLETPRRDVVLAKNHGAITFSALATPGRRINEALLTTRLLVALSKKESSVAIPYLDAQPVVTTDAALSALGVRELVGTAEMDFSGSSDGRTHNVRAGAEKINGIVIAAGETWSFNDALFPLSAADFVDQPVIKGGAFVPELGGGVCQVSSAVFRAALAAGVPIVERSPHSQKIEYYRPPGLDAAVYPGQKDLKFRNDTGRALVVQAAVIGQKIRVNLYGTRDGRAVRVVGPLTSEGAVITDVAAPRGSYLWTREIRRSDAPVLDEDFRANYRAG